MKRLSKLYTWVYLCLGDEWTNLTVGFWVFARGTISLACFCFQCAMLFSWLLKESMTSACGVT